MPILHSRDVMFFFSSRRRHTRSLCDWSSDVCSSDLWDLTTRYEDRFEVEDSDEWTAAMAEYNREADAITAAIFRAQGERSEERRVGKECRSAWSRRQ